MGIDGRDGDTYRAQVSQRWKTCMVCFWSLLVSMGGGVVLVYWETKYHPHNRELWMVPFGLVMFATPILVWLISIASDICCPTDQLRLDEPSQLGSATHFVRDPER